MRVCGMHVSGALLSTGPYKGDHMVFRHMGGRNNMTRAGVKHIADERWTGTANGGGGTQQLAVTPGEPGVHHGL